MRELYFSPMLLGLCLLLAVAVSATALWRVSRPYEGPGFWMAGCWTLIGGIVLFIGFMATGSPTLNVLGNAGQLAGEALFLLGIFRFMGRPLPWWIVPASVGTMVAFNVHYWMYDGNSDFLMGVYSTIAGLLPLQAIWLLARASDDQVTRPARRLVALSLLIYSVVTLLRGALGYLDWWQGQPYLMPYESFSYLLPYNFAIPALVMGFVGVTLMTMQRILARSEFHAGNARRNAQRFERLLGATTSGIAIVQDDRIVDANPGLELLSGYRRQQLIGQPVALLFDTGAQPTLTDFLKQGSVKQKDILARHQYLGAFEAELSVSTLGYQGRDRSLEIRDISRHKAMEAQLQDLATRDPLTGTYNRRAFNTAIDRELARSGRSERTFCLALLDLDHFKRINDRFGHGAGDEALKAFAECCQSQLRTSDMMARFGGEEFVLLLADTRASEAGPLLERIQKAVAALQIPVLSADYPIRFSAGVAQWQPGESRDELVGRADRALYKAKDSGRDRVVFAPDVGQSTSLSG